MIMKALTAMYYISWIFIGNFILLNLFLAILIDAFGEEDADLAEPDDDETMIKVAALKAKKIKEEKQKRMKKLGTSVSQMQKSKTIQVKPKKK